MVKSVSSRMSLRRWRKARSNGAAWRAGDSGARFSLIQRWRAFRSLKVGMPWQERLALANEARKRNCDERKMRERMDQLCRSWQESTGDL